jgi:hypothetical protein
MIMGAIQTPRSSIHRTLFYLLILLLPSQLGLHFWPEWALVLGRRVDYLSPTLYFTDILIVLLLLFWLIDGGFRVSGFGLRVINKFALPILIFAAVNIWFAVSRPVALYTWVKLLEFVLLSVYIVKTKPPFSLIVFSLAISVLWSSALAIVQFVLQRSVGGPLWLLGERTFTGSTPGIAQIPLCLPQSTGCPLTLRSYGTFPHPNVLGGFLAAVMPLIIYESANLRIMKLKAKQIQNDSRPLKLLYGLTIALGIIGLFVTFSRSAWAAGAAAIVFTIARIRNHELRILNNIYTKIFTVALALFILLYSVFNILNSSQESVVVRLQLNASAVAMWQHSPLFGTGLGNFIAALPDFLPSKFIYYLQPVHNIYLLVLSEIGVIGIGVFVLLGCILLNRESGVMKHGKLTMQKQHQSIIRYSVFILLILGLIDHYPLSVQQGRLLLTLLLGMAFAINNKQ